MHSMFGVGLRNWRLTWSSGHGAACSFIIVRTGLLQIAPARPSRARAAQPSSGRSESLPVSTAATPCERHTPRSSWRTRKRSRASGQIPPRTRRQECRILRLDDRASPHKQANMMLVGFTLQEKVVSGCGPMGLLPKIDFYEGGGHIVLIGPITRSAAAGQHDLRSSSARC